MLNVGVGLPDQRVDLLPVIDRGAAGAGVTAAVVPLGNGIHRNEPGAQPHPDGGIRLVIFLFQTSLLLHRYME